MGAFESEIRQKIDNHKTMLAEKIVDLQYSRQPEFWKPFGSKGRQLSVRDAGYHLPFLGEAIESGDKKIFTSYVAWVKKLFRGLHFPDDIMITTLACTRDVFIQELPNDMATVSTDYINAGIKQMYMHLEESVPYIHTDEPLGTLALAYNEALLAGDRHTAAKLVLDAAKDGTPVKDIYLHVFQKSQYEVGRLWLDNKISVAREHFCSAATQQIMTQLYPFIFSTERKGIKMVAANVGGELHEIGIRMVADFFEMDGWDTYYLGANTPIRSIISAIQDYQADMVGLSIAIPYHRSTLKESVRLIREQLKDKVKVMIGGVALSGNGHQINEFSADGYAPDAQQAVLTANNIISN
jgi:MerR family transcriptional regulator, light-induced transcriptional regulator